MQHAAHYNSSYFVLSYICSFMPCAVGHKCHEAGQHGKHAACIHTHAQMQVVRMLTSHSLYALSVAKIGIGCMHLTQIQRQVEGASITVAPMAHHARHMPQNGAQQVVGRHVMWTCHGGVVQSVLQQNASSNKGVALAARGTQSTALRCSRAPLACRKGL